VPRLCELYPGIRLSTEEKARKTLSQVANSMKQVYNSNHTVHSPTSYIAFPQIFHIPHCHTNIRWALSEFWFRHQNSETILRCPIYWRFPYNVPNLDPQKLREQTRINFNKRSGHFVAGSVSNVYTWSHLKCYNIFVSVATFSLSNRLLFFPRKQILFSSDNLFVSTRGWRGKLVRGVTERTNLPTFYPRFKNIIL